MLPTTWRPIKIRGNSAQQEKINYAWAISKSKDFVYTLEAENSYWEHDRKHHKPYHLCWNEKTWNAKKAPNQTENMGRCRAEEPGWFWRKHYDWGFGISDGYYKEIVDDPRFFLDWRWQMEETWKLYQNGTRFYGSDKADQMKSRFINPQ